VSKMRTYCVLTPSSVVLAAVVVAVMVSLRMRR
jgi:hypothetical protein